MWYKVNYERNLYDTTSRSKLVDESSVGQQGYENITLHIKDPMDNPPNLL